MGKISNNELASALIERRHLSKKEASRFVNELFNVIRQGLMNDRMVKVKGLGTFKIIDVDDRESVNVNTGERVLIEGHSKISFLPDQLMKELVNKPFSQFETVVLKDGVNFDETIESEAVEEQQQAVVTPEPEPAPEPEPVVMSEPEPAPEPEPVVMPESEPEPTSFYEEDLEPSTAPLVDFVEDKSEEIIEDQPEETVVEKPEEIVEEKAEEESDVKADGEEKETEESDETETPLYDFDEEESTSHWKRWAMIAALCCVCFAGGYFVGQHFAKESVASSVAQPEVKPITQPKAKSVAKQETQPEVKPEEKAEAKPEPQKEVQPETKPEPKVEPKPETKPEPKVEPKPEAKPESAVALDQYEKMDVRVRTGAYRIVGTDRLEKVKPGDNLSRICKRTIGPGMECYLEVYNGIKGDADLKVGQNIKIPKLEHKKKKAKIAN